VILQATYTATYGTHPDYADYFAECLYDTDSKTVHTVGTLTRPDGLSLIDLGVDDVLEDETVTLPDGTTLSEFDGVTFDTHAATFASLDNGRHFLIAHEEDYCYTKTGPDTATDQDGNTKTWLNPDTLVHPLPG
jgi:hypothetical protein